MEVHHHAHTARKKWSHYDDQRLIVEYINRITTKALRTRIYLGELEEGLKSANSLAHLIREEYHLSEGTPLEK